jgi:DNA repair protein RecN (Recombination protein N)
VIRTLSIHNLALIDEITIEFEAGLNVFTGETGAGKTIIVSGLDLLIGARADSDRIRSGEERLEVEGVFSCPAGGEVARILEEQGLADETEPDLVLVRRVVTRDGKNRCWVNGRICGASTLAALGEYMVDIHGQHEHQRLLNPRNHLEYLDCFGGDGHLARLAEYHAAFAAWREAKRRAEEAHLNEAERLQQLDILGFQVKEIEQVGPVEGELEELEELRRLMQNREVLFSQAGEALEALSGEGTGSTETLAAAVSALGKAEAVDPRLERLRAELEDAATRVEETARELRGYLEGLQFEPAELEETERRIFDLKDLYRKYGASFEEVMAFAEKAAARLRELENYDDNRERLRGEVEQREKEAAALAAEVGTRRRELAGRLEVEAMGELAELGMEGVTFTVGLQPREGFGETGAEAVEFMISPGRGEPAKPIARIASGGELARLMLALKIVLARADQVDVLVFDEVDAGIGGLTAGKIGAKMATLAAYHQVITVTHLPQIAARATSQFRISKSEKGRRRVTGIERLDAEGRREEIARMLGGTSESALRHADELLRENPAVTTRP